MEFVKLDLMTDGVCFVEDPEDDEDDNDNDAESWGFKAD
jgi:hypothetical protein